MAAGKLGIRSTDTCLVKESVATAATRMLDRNVGSLVVVNDTHEPVGIITDRDLTVRVLASGKESTISVGQVMTRDPQVVGEDFELEDVLRIMRWGGFRRVPVVDNRGRLMGIVCLDDILNMLSDEFSSISRMLHKEEPNSLASV